MLPDHWVLGAERRKPVARLWRAPPHPQMFLTLSDPHDPSLLPLFQFVVSPFQAFLRGGIKAVGIRLPAPRVLSDNLQIKKEKRLFGDWMGEGRGGAESLDSQGGGRWCPCSKLPVCVSGKALISSFVGFLMYNSRLLR